MKTSLIRSVPCFLATLSAFAAGADVLDNAWLKGTTDKNPLFYTPGEPMVFTIEPQGIEGEVPEGAFFLKWERTGDDGVTEKDKIPFDGKPFVYTTSLAKPGFVRVQAEVVTPDGKPYQKKFTGDATTPEGKIAMNKFEKAKKTVFFDGGAGVDIDLLQQGSPEPADFDAFWARQKALLAEVPIRAERIEVPCDNPAVRLYAVSLDCAGSAPVTGYLSIPKAADEGKKFPARAGGPGYGVREQTAPKNPPSGAIMFSINAHGMLLREFGGTDEYYKGFGDTIKSNGKSYGLDPVQNTDPETAYFRGMILRMIRALQYVKTLPEWNGRDLVVSGGSQGGAFAIWAAGCGEGVTRAESSITGFCDMGKDLVGRLRGGWPRFVHAPGLDYLDPVNFAKRIPATCVVDIPRAGLGDYTCEPSGIAVLWNNLRCPKSILWMQGSEHGYVPPAYEGRDFRRKADAAAP